MDTTPTILTVDEQRTVCALFERLFRPVYEVQHVFTLAEAHDLVRSLPVLSGAIVDVSITGGRRMSDDGALVDGFGLLEEIRARRGDVPLVIFTANVDDATVNRAFALGASVVAKRESEGVLQMLPVHLLAAEQARGSMPTRGVQRFIARHGLSARHAHVLTLAMMDPRRKVIAERLGISPQTVRDYVRNIIQASGASSFRDALDLVRNSDYREERKCRPLVAD